MLEPVTKVLGDLVSVELNGLYSIQPVLNALHIFHPCSMKAEGIIENPFHSHVDPFKI